MATTGHESEAINVQGLKASLQNLKNAHIDSKAEKASITAGSYNKVTVNGQGIVTGGSNPDTLAGHGITDAYTKSETYTKTEVNGLVDTPHQEYVTVSATSQTTDVTTVLPNSGQSADTIYRVSNWDGSANSGAGAFDVTKYSEYAWDDVSSPNKYVFLCVKSQLDEVFDISVYNNNAQYADLKAALGTNGANVPQSLQRGGMSVKFVQSSDNKYVQYFLTKDEWSVNEADWVIVLTDKVIDAVNVEMNRGSFIRPNGTTGSNQDMFISDTISLYKGDILKVNVKASASTSVISKVVSENTYQSLVVGSDGYHVVEYTYTATENCTVVISGINSGGLSGTITYKGIINKINETIQQVDKIKEEIEGGAYHKEVTPEMYSGQFVDSNGVVQTSHSQSPYYDMTKPIDMKQGDVLTLNGAGVEIAAAISLYKNGVYIVKSVYSGVSAAMQTFTFTATEDCQVICCYRKDNGTWTHSIAIDGIEPSVNEKIEAVNTKVNNLSESVIKENVIEVGTGKDFTSLVAAIESINDSSYLNQYKILLYEGEYETVVEADIEEGYRGLIIPDYVSIIGIGNRDNIIIKGTLPSASYAAYASTISTINLMMNGVVENVTIKSKNLRYCNHDDAGSIGMVDDAKHTFRYVRFVTDVMDSGIDTAGNCVGIGSQVNKEVVFENCVFETLDSANRTALVIHDNSSSSQKRGARISILNCLFKMTWYDIRVGNSGGDMLSFITMTGNRLSFGIRVEASSGVNHNIWKLTATNNDQYRLDNSITGVDISGDVVAFNNIAIQ